MGKKNKSNKESSTDYFARVTAVLGLIIAIAAVIVPIWQQSEADQERLDVWMRANPNGIVLIPDDRHNSNVVQVPWLFTLSNTGKVKLSITGYDVFQMENGTLSKFSNIVDLARNTDGTQVIPPLTLDSGESITIKMHLGFMAKAGILDNLYMLHKKAGAFTLKDSFKYLAEHGKTIYGGKATYKEHDGSVLISVDPQFYQHEPVYRVEFKTGRKESFFVQGSETVSKFSR